MGVGQTENISNNPGYDNQPSFLPDGSGVLFTSNRDSKQTDIYRYDFGSKSLTQLTRTPESEYSPLVTPDRKTFSVIRVEADGTQRLWRFDLDGSNPRLILENVKPVGYHVWVDATRLALFVLGGQGQPNTLQLADTKTGAAEVIESGIGRSLLMRPGMGTVSYISKPSGGRWVVKELNPATRATATIVETVDNNVSEDVAWHPNGRLLMASGSKLFIWSPANPKWTELADQTSGGIGRITRLAIGVQNGARPRIAFVAEPPR
jgi:Tol biopolymer transport system component